jgi:hypothetical protein
MSGDSVQVRLPAPSSMDDRRGLRPWLISSSISDEKNTRLRLAAKTFFSMRVCMNFLELKVFTL